ncbi:hypothetical protein ABMY47_21635 [Pseudoalteromonas sp. BZP1]|uniref:hypothetical protein n=1 Tax=unclassified Pseudoalteromonas TaxID=194690 RepID=UPI0032C47AD9|tara:strand:- start:23 stop:217 length:195 start_codon:yes stop_codon:yes gene_type:complete
MKLFSLVTLFTASFFTSSAFADFNFPGDGTLKYPTGIEKAFKFGFAWQQGSEKFTIGGRCFLKV